MAKFIKGNLSDLKAEFNLTFGSVIFHGDCLIWTKIRSEVLCKSVNHIAYFRDGDSMLMVMKPIHGDPTLFQVLTHVENQIQSAIS